MTYFNVTDNILLKEKREERKKARKRVKKNNSG